MRGHFAKAGTEAGRKLWELRVDAETAEQYPAGSELTVAVLEEGQKVDVEGQQSAEGSPASCGVMVLRRPCYTATLWHTVSPVLSVRTRIRGGFLKKDGRPYGQRESGSANLEVVRVDAKRTVLIRARCLAQKGLTFD